MATITLCEFDAGFTWSRYEEYDSSRVVWINHDSGIFMTAFGGDYGIASFWLDPTPHTRTVTRVGSVFFNAVNELTQVFSLDQLDTEPSFFYDAPNERLYIRLPNWQPPDTYDLTIGISTSVAMRAYVDPVLGLPYQPRLQNAPAIEKSIDRMFFGRVSYDDASVDIENSDGFYDQITENDVYGQQLRLYTGDDSQSRDQMYRAWTGYIRGFQLTEQLMKVRASDTRRALQTPIPPSSFFPSTYTDLDDSDIGKPIPLAYGIVKNAQPVCVNRTIFDEQSDQDFTFKICDMTNHTAISSVDTVYYQGSALPTADAGGSRHWKSTNLSTGEIVINKDANTDLDFTAITVDFKGYEDSGGSLISKGLDIAKDILDTFADVPFTTANFDTTEWNAASSSDYDMGLYIDSDSDVVSAIERIVASIPAQFYVEDNGLYTIKLYDPEQTPRRNIYKEEWLSDLEFDYDSDEFLSSAKIEYARGRAYIKTDEEARVEERFRQKRQKTFETALTSETDATSFADDIMRFSTDLFPTVSRLVKAFSGVSGVLDPLELQVEDIIQADLDRTAQSWLGWSRCRIEGRRLDLNDNEAELTFRVIKSGLVDTQLVAGDSTDTSWPTEFDGGGTALVATWDTEFRGGNSDTEFLEVI